MTAELMVAEASMTEETIDVGRMAQAVADARKDGLMVDFARLIAVHYGKMVEAVSAHEGRPVSAHNNKTVFLEAIDLWCRARLSPSAARGPRVSAARGTVASPAEVAEHAMRPWYEALALEDPSRYRMRQAAPPPVYVGSPVDSLCFELGLCACLDITPIRFRFGLRNGKPERVWGRVEADGTFYDTDPNEPGFVLGDHPEFPEYKEIEVPL